MNCFTSDGEDFRCGLNYLETIENEIEIENQQDKVGENIENHGDDDLVEIGVDDVDVENEPIIGMTFGSESAGYNFYNRYSRRLGFSIHIQNGRRSTKDNDFIFRVYVCSRQGQRRNNTLRGVNNNQNLHLLSRVGCNATMVMSRNIEKTWIVKKFIKEHNHILASPRKVPFLKSHRKLDLTKKNFIYSCDDAGLRLKNIMSLLTQEARGTENVCISERQVRNLVDNSRRKTLSIGDAKTVRKWCQRMQMENPSFFYAIQANEEMRITIFFWIDAKSRMNYHYFGDVVVFNTTYRTNRYKMPFAPFTGVNNHYQSTLFGCALLPNEGTSSFEWLFKTWLEAMSGRAPLSIITDQDPAIRAAILKVFPNTQHRFCLWHILRKCPEKISHVYHKHPKFHTDFKSCIYNTKTVDQLERYWQSLMDEYDLSEIHWLQTLYNIRQQWVPVYFKEMFFAGMTTTQRSESMNGFFDGYVDAQTTLLEFVKKYARAMASRYAAENSADYDSIHKSPNLLTFFPIEKHVASIYTITLFKKFQNELCKSSGYIATPSHNDGLTTTYIVVKFQHDQQYIVMFHASEQKASCSCKKFEFLGILCKHILKIFTLFQLTEIPSHYILKRWTKEAKKNDVTDKEGALIETNLQLSGVMRYNNVCRESNKLAHDAFRSINIYKKVMHDLKNILLKVASMKEIEGVNDDYGASGSGNIMKENTSESIALTLGITLHDPIKASTKGEKRIKTGVEKVQQTRRKCKGCDGHGHNIRSCPTLKGTSSNVASDEEMDNFEEPTLL